MTTQTEKKKYTGGDAALDAALKSYSERYFAAKASGDAAGMREANDAANQLRNQKGYAAELAAEDIAKTAAAAAKGSSGGRSGSAGESGPRDYSGYIEEMNRARQEAALSELEAAYQKNLAALERSGAEIAPAYRQARNRAAGESETAKRQFAEYAAARGLGSGAAGQAELARQSALQNSLGTLNAQEAEKRADLELQRSQLESDYNTAAAKARSEGAYALAGQLYEEKVRLEEAWRQARQDQLKQDQQAWENEYRLSRDAVEDRRYSDEQSYKKAAQSAELMAGVGDFSGYSALWNLSEAQTRALVEAYAQEKATSQAAAARDLADWYAKYGDFSRLKAMGVDTSAKTAAKTSGSTSRRSGSRGGSSGASSGGRQDYSGLFSAAGASGHAKSFIANNYKRYGFTSSSGLYDDYTDWKKSQSGSVTDYTSAQEQLRWEGISTEGLMTQREWVQCKRAGDDPEGAGAYASYKDYLQGYIRSARR